LVVFRTTPNDKNKCIIISNTTRLNNEIIKQRLSCIPINMNIEDFKNYKMELNVENETDNIIVVTTENFIVKDINTDNILPLEKIREIFPVNVVTGCYIDFVKLRPKISNELPGEKIYLKCDFDIGYAKEDGMFNAVSTCSYAFTEDIHGQELELIKKKQFWKDEGKTVDEINFNAINWKLLDAKRIFIKDSFDFIIESVGVYTNIEILIIACDILISKLTSINNLIENDELEINSSDNTISNCYDIILNNEDYTIGKILEFILFTKFYETDIATFCSFKKIHPHDIFGIIRLAYKKSVDKTIVKNNLKECCDDAIKIYTKIKTDFTMLK